MRRSGNQTPRIPLAVRLTSERNMRINERFAARARMRKVLDSDIGRMLRTAQDALGNEPAYPNVARERISRTLDLIADECAKLDREDQADQARR